MSADDQTEELERGQSEEPDSMQQFVRRRAQTLAESATSGVLGTLDEDGYPYTSLVEVMFDGDDSFWMLLSNLAVHTRNIGRDVRASLLLRDRPDEDDEALQTTRGSYMGRVVEMEHRREEIEPRYLEVHPHAEDFVQFSDFRFYRFRIERVRLVAGFGRIGWVDVDEMGVDDQEQQRG